MGFSFLRKTLNFSWIFCKMSEGEGRMNKMYQRLKRKCISLVLFALLVAFIVPYYAYAADNGAEPAAAASAAESTGDFSMSERETSESETSKREARMAIFRAMVYLCGLRKRRSSRPGKMQMHQQVQRQMYRKVHKNRH